MPVRSQLWFYTLFSDFPLTGIPQLAYHVYQKERCGTTGREHYQGFIALTKPLSRTRLIKTLSTQNLHLEIPRNALASLRYCIKLSTRILPPVIQVQTAFAVCASATVTPTTVVTLEDA